MAAGKFTLYNSFAELIGDATIDLDGHVFNVALLDAGYTPSLAHDEYTDVSGNEIAGVDGYTTGGESLANITWGQTGGVATFDSDPVEWLASGGGITARYAVMYDDTSSGKKLVGYMLLDTAPADVTATAGNTFKITPNGSAGWMQNTVNP